LQKLRRYPSESWLIEEILDTLQRSY
jgi:hypothetical protein